jgi:hypothetical protein
VPKYIVPGIPQGAQLSAFMPNWVRLAQSGAVRYKQAVSGSPGTQSIPAPTTNTVPSPDLGDIAQMGTARSSDAPQSWNPQLYYQTALTERPGAGMPIRVYSDNLMPVPAVDGRGRGAVLARPVVQRGQQQIGMPRVIPSWGAGG